MSTQLITITRLEQILSKHLIVDECSLCAKGLNTPDQTCIYLCLTCGEIYCKAHFLSIHIEKFATHQLAAQVGIQAEVEDQSKTHSIQVNLVRMAPFCLDFVDPSPNDNDLLRRISEIYQLHDLNVIIFPSSLSDATSCPHAEPNSPQLPNKIGVVGECEDCKMTDRLWICFTCSRIFCGRKQYDGTGGNGHAREHFEQSGHPVTLRLGTIQSDDPEIFCYLCDDMIGLTKSLSSFITFVMGSTSLIKREQSLLELGQSKRPPPAMNIIDQDPLENRYLRSIDEEQHVPCYSYNGLKNLGNSCYISVILQTLFQFPLQRRRQISDLHFNVCHKNPLLCIECQLIKISSALSDNSISHFANGIAPVSLRRLLISHLPFITASNSEQDAAEFLQFFFQLLENLSSFQEYLGLFPQGIKKESYCKGPQRHIESVSMISELSAPLAIVLNQDTPSVKEALEKYFSEEATSQLWCSKCTGRLVTRVFIEEKAKFRLARFFVQLHLFEFMGGKVVKKPLDMTKFSIDKEIPCKLINRKQPRVSISNSLANDFIDMGFTKAHIQRAISAIGFSNDPQVILDWLCSNPETNSCNDNYSTEHYRDVPLECEYRPNDVYYLSGVICHRGESVHCGHYYVYLKDEDNRWILFDDEKVYMVSDEKMIKFSDAYLLLYSIDE